MIHPEFTDATEVLGVTEMAGLQADEALGDRLLCSMITQRPKPVMKIVVRPTSIICEL